MKEYKGKSNPYERFINDCFYTLGGFSTSAELFEAWENWCQENGFDPGTEIEFGKALERKGYKGGRKRIEGHQVRIRVGIMLKSKAREQLVQRRLESAGRKKRTKVSESE